MSAVRTPSKPDRTRDVDGRFRCYRCPAELAVAGVREKCCRHCLLLLVRKLFATEFAGLRQNLAGYRLGKNQNLLNGPPQQLQWKAQNVDNTNLSQEDDGPPLFVAVSGGDASLSLLHCANELVQRRLKAIHMQRQKLQRLWPCTSNQGGPGQTQGPEFGCCITLHVDLQRLFVPPATVVRVNTRTESQIEAERSSATLQLPEGTKGSDAAYGLQLPVAASQSLPLQLQRAIARQWPEVRCVLLHPSGHEFSVVEDESSGSHVEVYKEPENKNCNREQLESMLQEEAMLRQCLAQTFAEDKTAAEHFCRAITLRAVRHYMSRLLSPATLPQALNGHLNVGVDEHQLRSTMQVAPVNIPAFVCMGDSAGAAALGILERISYGEGRLLATESALVDDRHLPLFHLCRPLVELSKKELALFRFFEGISVLPTNPYLLHRDLLPSPAGVTLRNPHPSVRWLLQEFLIELQKDNSAVVHNFISACRKLEPTFTKWNQSDTPCCLCWKSPAVDLLQILGEQHVGTPKQMLIAEEHLLPSATANRLCFACLRDATASGSAAQMARILAYDL